MLVLGIDSSTQSTKALVVDADSGEVVAEAKASHPDGTEVDPKAWWDAAQSAIGEAVARAPGRIEAVSVGGQQHGMVALDDQGEVVRDALLWNDTRSAPQADELTARHGAKELAARTGSVPVASFTITKLAWLAHNEPQHADRVAQVLLPHDWVSWQLAGRPERTWTDHGDASGTGYYSPTTGEWLPDLLTDAMAGRTPAVPEVLAPNARAGQAALPGIEGATIGVGTGDNMAAALGLGLKPGDVAVSLGTSGAVFAPAEQASADETGTVAGFCDATGRYLPLVCTLNAARVLTSTAQVLDTDLEGLSRLALSAEPGAGGLSLLPYLEGERTPNLPEATGTLTGLTGANMTPQNLARAAVEGMLCGMADAIEALRDTGAEVRRVLLIGGAARSEAVQGIAPSLFGVDVDVPDPAEYVALGAAKQAAWACSGAATPPEWEVAGTRRAVGDDTSGRAVRAAYSRARNQVHGI
ncbi:xylulokinase [Saccharopolyspora rhizosphaerae]|uniref:Xylulose kinase n=1 Tax=Saccharopolyspora rhizosphaerae TaxID=2492662 RepID=A0A3R8P3L1_9PSEU|nr:xylulokinase [Saccharopolyspora rhizosphaerae]RRO18874.1 xylulokinase [Saccharopolyspora rhizosphaerae]